VCDPEMLKALNNITSKKFKSHIIQVFFFFFEWPYYPSMHLKG